MNGGISGGLNEMGCDPYVLNLFQDDKAYCWSRKGWTGKYCLLKAEKGTCSHLLCVTAGESRGTSIPCNCLLSPSTGMHIQHTCAIQSHALLPNFSFFAMIHWWEVQVYCLFMGALESQMGQTKLYEGLDKNVAVKKRGHAGIHNLREKTESY